MIPNTNHESARVLIVGAGPTGLTLAIALSKYGVPFRIVDKRKGADMSTKALAINFSSLYGFEMLDAGADILGKAGRAGSRLTVYWNGRRFAAVDFRHLDFHLKSFISQPQSDTENDLIEILRMQKHEVEWDTRVVEVSQSESSGEAVIENALGEKICERFSYVVGCDGKYSVIAKHMPVQYSGKQYPMYLALGDFRMNWDKKENEVFYYIYDDTFLVVVPVKEGYWRLVVKHDGEVPQRDVCQQDITETVQRCLGNVIVGEPAWLSRSPLYMRVSDRLKWGRLFIAGDAAHLVSPIGGTGMNAGMLDAMNLAWKMSYVANGRADDSFLDTYDAERREAMLATAAVTDRSTRLMARMERNPAAVEPLAPRLKNRTTFRGLLPVLHSGLGVSYSHAFASQYDASVDHPLVGRLCLGAGQLLKMLRRHHSLPIAPLLCVAHMAEGDGDTVRVLEQLRGLQSAYSHLVKVVVLPPARHGSLIDPATIPSLAVVNIDPVLRGRVGIPPGCVALVLPDGFVAFSERFTEFERLRALLRKRFSVKRDRSAAGDRAQLR